MVEATPDHETVYDTIDEYEMASLSSRAEPMRGGELCSTPRLSRLSCEAGLLALCNTIKGNHVNYIDAFNPTLYPPVYLYILLPMQQTLPCLYRIVRNI